MTTPYCPVCGCEPAAWNPEKHRWCAVALAYGWPDPLPKLPTRAEVPPPPTTATCPQCGGEMPRLTRDGRDVRKFCSRHCCGRAEAEAKAEKRAALVEDVRDLLGMGESPASVLSRLGKTACGMERAMDRAGQHGLARLFGRERRHGHHRMVA